MIKLTFSGETPSKKNQRRIVCRGTRPLSLPSERYVAWHTEQLYALKKQRDSFEKPVAVDMRYFPKNFRKCDLSNRVESIMDLLVDAGILKDDCWQWVRHVGADFGAVDKEHPRMEVTIQELDEK